MFRQKRDVSSDDSAVQFLLAEYQGVRAEAVQSFQNAQSIIQWSLATYGVLFGAGLVALTDSKGQAHVFVSYAALILFSILLPGLITAAAWQWLGEITRMERTGVYLRGLEKRLADQAAFPVVAGLPRPLSWETFLAGNDKTNKHTAPYFGTAAMFGGAFLASLSFSILWQAQLPFGVFSFPSVIWLYVDGLLLLVFVLPSIRMGVFVIWLGGRRYDFSANELEAIRQPAAGAKHPSAWRRITRGLLGWPHN